MTLVVVATIRVFRITGTLLSMRRALGARREMVDARNKMRGSRDAYVLGMSEKLRSQAMEVWQRSQDSEQYWTASRHLLRAPVLEALERGEAGIAGKSAAAVNIERERLRTACIVCGEYENKLDIKRWLLTASSSESALRCCGVRQGLFRGAGADGLILLGGN